MAKQHFYSRVPARASMYNRTDGFDTFAHSCGLERAFVERELAAVYENKLGKTDVDAVRQGRMPVVYSQTVLKTQQVVQSCVSYLSKDYTGERCAYLCHSLILSEEELACLHSEGNAPLNPEMFVSDSSAFDFQNLTADDAYPDTAYVPCAGVDPAELPEKYNPNALKAFLFALLGVLCAKGKTLYFKLSGDAQDVSEEALKFIAGITAVIPYHLRKTLSFVTYITDPAQYAHVKVKCMAADCPEPSKAKGIFVDLSTGLVTGMPAGDAMSKAPVDFFYSLLENSSVRNAFLRFVDTAVRAMPSLEKMNMKALSDLVFLFGGASGLFDRQTVLPTDGDVYDFFVTYEKYRDALDGEYRCNAYKCLERYPQKHLAIPKNIFSKLCKLYPADDPSAKRIAMQVVLELIHTDIMRDKLFAFLKSNYHSEAPDMQSVIDLDLCSVFYGGFLQEQILAFFAEHFSQASEKVRDTIFEKLMLSIRTASVQEKILQFVRDNYGCLTENEKQQFFATAYEMLPECDQLSAGLISVLNHCLAGESVLCRQQERMRLTEVLDADSKKSEHRLLPLLCAEHGFCYETVLQLVLGPWNSRKIYGEYLGLLTQMDVLTKTGELVYAVSVMTERGEETAAKLMLALDQIYAPDKNADLYQWLGADTLARKELTKYSQAFAYLLRTKIIHKAISQRVGDVFDMRLRKDGVEIITRYAQINHYLAEDANYRVVERFLQLIAAAENGQEKQLFRILETLCQYEELRSNMASCIRTVYLNWENQTPATAVLYEMSCNMLQNNRLLSEMLYTECKAACAKEVWQQQPKVKSAKANTLAAGKAGELLLEYMAAACNVSVPVYEAVCADTECLQEFVRLFCADYGRGGGKWMVARLSNGPARLVSAVKNASAGVKARGGSIFKKLFRK